MDFEIRSTRLNFDDFLKAQKSEGSLLKSPIISYKIV